MLRFDGLWGYVDDIDLLPLPPFTKILKGLTAIRLTPICATFMALSTVCVGQSGRSGRLKELVKWSGNLQSEGDYSDYTPAGQTVPPTKAYLFSAQQAVVAGIPFAGDLFLSSYRSAALNRYSLSYDPHAMRGAIRQRIEKKVAEMKELHPINDMQEKIDKLERPEQYEQLYSRSRRNVRIANEMEKDPEYSAIRQSQEQWSRFNPGEYADYEQYLRLKPLAGGQDCRKQLKWLEQEGIVSSAEKFWYGFDAIQVGTATPYFSGLDLAGVPVKGYYAAYGNPYFYLASTEGATLPFSVPDSAMAFTRDVKAYKLGIGAAGSSHLHVSYLKGRDRQHDGSEALQSNAVAGIDGRLTLFRNKLDLQARKYTGAYTDNLYAQSESGAIETGDLSQIPSLANLLAKDAGLNQTTTSGGAYEAAVQYRQQGFAVSSELRRTDPAYRSMGLAYLRTDVQHYALSLEKSMMNGRMRIDARMRMDEDNLNGAKQYTGKNLNGQLRIHTSFLKAPGVSLVYMPNFYTSIPASEGKIQRQESHLLSANSSKAYRLFTLNQVTSGSVAFNFYNTSSGTFNALNASLNQSVALSDRYRAALQLIYRQTGSFNYRMFTPSLQYAIPRRGRARLSFTYGTDDAGNMRYGFDLGMDLNINKYLSFALSVAQNRYSQEHDLSDLRIRSSLRASW